MFLKYNLVVIVDIFLITNVIYLHASLASSIGDPNRQRGETLPEEPSGITEKQLKETPDTTGEFGGHQDVDDNAQKVSFGEERKSDFRQEEAARRLSEATPVDDGANESNNEQQPDITGNVSSNGSHEEETMTPPPPRRHSVSSPANKDSNNLPLESDDEENRTDHSSEHFIESGGLHHSVRQPPESPDQTDQPVLPQGPEVPGPTKNVELDEERSGEHPHRHRPTVLDTSTEQKEELTTIATPTMQTTPGLTASQQSGTFSTPSSIDHSQHRHQPQKSKITKSADETGASSVDSSANLSVPHTETGRKDEEVKTHPAMDEHRQYRFHPHRQQSDDQQVDEPTRATTISPDPVATFQPQDTLPLSSTSAPVTPSSEELPEPSIGHAEAEPSTVVEEHDETGKNLSHESVSPAFDGDSEQPPEHVPESSDVEQRQSQEMPYTDQNVDPQRPSGLHPSSQFHAGFPGSSMVLPQAEQQEAPFEAGFNPDHMSQPNIEEPPPGHLRSHEGQPNIEAPQGHAEPHDTHIEPEPGTHRPPIRPKPSDMFGKLRQKASTPPVEQEVPQVSTTPPTFHEEPTTPLQPETIVQSETDEDHHPMSADSPAETTPEELPLDVPPQEFEAPRHHHHHDEDENKTHYLLDDVIEHYLDGLPASAKAFLKSQPFGFSLSTTVMATLIPIVVFMWSTLSLVISSLFGPKRVAPKIDLEYVRNLEAKFFSVEKELKDLKKREEEFAAGGGKALIDRQGEIDVLQSQIVHFQSEIKRATEELQSEKRLHAETGVLAQQFEEENSRLMKDLNSLEDKVRELDALLLLKKEEHMTLATQVNDLEGSIATLTGQYEDAVKHNEELSKQVETRTQEVEHLASQYVELEAYCGERVRDYEALYKSFSELETLQQSADESEESREEKLKRLVDASKVRAELDVAKSEVSKLEDELEEAKGTSGALEQKVTQLRNESDQLKKSESTAQQAKREAETKLSVLSEYFTTRELELQKQIGEQSVWRKQGENQTDSLTNQVLHLEAEVKAHVDQVEYLKSELHMVEQTHKTAIAREEKKALESWTSARSLERQLKEAQAEAEALRLQLTSAVTGANRAGGSQNMHFVPPPPGLIPPMPPNLMQPPPHWALRPPSDASSPTATSPRMADNSFVRSPVTDASGAPIPNVSQSSPQWNNMPIRPAFRPLIGSGLPPPPPVTQGGRGLSPAMPPGPHGSLSTPPVRPGMPFPPMRPPMPTMPGQPPRFMVPPHPYSSNESVPGDEEDDTDSETGDSGSLTSASDDEELRDLAAGGGPPPPFPSGMRPPFMPPPGAPPGSFPPGQFPPFPGPPPFVPGGAMPPRGVAGPTPPSFNFRGPSPANFGAPMPQNLQQPPHNQFMNRPPQANSGRLGP